MFTNEERGGAEASRTHQHSLMEGHDVDLMGVRELKAYITANGGSTTGRGLHSFTFQLNLSRV